MSLGKNMRKENKFLYVYNNKKEGVFILDEVFAPVSLMKEQQPEAFSAAEVMKPMASNTGDRLSGTHYASIPAMPAIMSVAMAYVPMQTDTSTYEAEEALMHGTLFHSLNKPFLGAGR